MVAGATPSHQPPPGRGQDALGFILDDHVALRQICADIDQICKAQPDEILALAKATLDYLRGAYVDHHADEEASLYPALRRRCLPEDEIEVILEKLEIDHIKGVASFAAVSRILDGLSMEKTTLTLKEKRTLEDFAATERRHVIVENAIVVPLARARLTEDDYEEILAQMLARRGLDRTDAVTSGVWRQDPAPKGQS